jgi:uncharacterized membrane protein YphA (DoxX/SURF4 family)
MKNCCKKFFTDPEYFGAVALRLTFGLVFVLAAVAKFRMGFSGFADIVVSGEGNLASEMPAVILQAYGYALPILELIAGVLLLSGCKKHAKYGFGLAGIIYLTFVFGQAYDANIAVVGTEYLPSLLALYFGFHLFAKTSKK